MKEGWNGGIVVVVAVVVGIGEVSDKTLKIRAVEEVIVVGVGSSGWRWWWWWRWVEL